MRFLDKATLYERGSKIGRTTTPASITCLEPHTCSPATHYNAKQSQSVKYLARHHRASVIDNGNIFARCNSAFFFLASERYGLVIEPLNLSERALCFSDSSLKF
jgi:hypothetical protein